MRRRWIHMIHRIPSWRPEAQNAQGPMSPAARGPALIEKTLPVLNSPARIHKTPMPSLERPQNRDNRKHFPHRPVEPFCPGPAAAQCLSGAPYDVPIKYKDPICSRSGATIPSTRPAVQTGSPTEVRIGFVASSQQDRPRSLSLRCMMYLKLSVWSLQD